MPSVVPALLDWTGHPVSSKGAPQAWESFDFDEQVAFQLLVHRAAESGAEISPANAAFAASFLHLLDDVPAGRCQEIVETGTRKLRRRGILETLPSGEGAMHLDLVTVRDIQVLGPVGRA